MLQTFFVCLLALAGTQANHINQYNGYRTLSGYGNNVQSLQRQPSFTSSFMTAQKPSIIAAPLTQQLDNGYGQQQQQQQVLPQVQFQQQAAEPVNSGYGQQVPVAPQVQVVQQQSRGYGQITPVEPQILPQVQQQQQNTGYGQQTPVEPQILPQVQQQQTTGYGQQIPVEPQILPQVHQQQQQHDSYGQQTAPMSPMALFMAQPAIQQLISTMVQQYHGNNLGAPQEMKNTCAVGFTQPIYESTEVTETYCRCPSGSYGFTCTENFANPCLDGSIEFTAADSRVPSTYFIKCSWGIPYLNKCPSGTVRWSQELQACVADETPLQTPVASSQSSYGSYQQPQVQQPQVQQTIVRQQSRGY